MISYTLLEEIEPPPKTPPKPVPRPTANLLNSVTSVTTSECNTLVVLFLGSVLVVTLMDSFK